MKKIQLFALTALTVFAFSCNPIDPDDPKHDPKDDPKEDPQDDPQEKDDPNATTFTISGLELEAGESVGVFPADGLASEFKLADGSTTKITGEKFDVTEFWAVYPYSNKDILVEGTVSTLIPFEQPASGWNMKVAHTTGKELKFNDALSFIKFKVEGSDVKEVVLRSNDSKAYLAGTVDITIGDNGATDVTITDGVPWIVLTPAKGKSTIDAGEYTLAVAPCSLTKGLSIRVKTVVDGGDDLMFVKNDETARTTGATVLDLGTLSTSGCTKYIEKLINDDGAGIAGWYREFGTSSIDTAPRYLVNLGDYDLSTCWAMPGGSLGGGTGSCVALDGSASIRGPYLRLNLSTADSKNAYFTPSMFWEYSIPYEPTNEDRMYGLNFAPWTLRLQDYNVANGGKDYGVFRELTVEEDALPWTYEYNNRYISDNEGFHQRPSDGLIHTFIICASRTRKCDFEPQPKDADSGFEFMDLLKETPDYQWGMSELHIWLEEKK